MLAGPFGVRLRQGPVSELRSGDLQASLLPLGTGANEVLPGGLVLSRNASTVELQELHLEPRSISIVTELDSTTQRILRVYHRRRGAWRDITTEVGWVELNFQLEPSR